MEIEKVYIKFGNASYRVNEATFKMGVHYLLADQIARRFLDYDTVLDACCGAGFMSIALAKYTRKVIAVDINSEYLEQAEHNARIAGVHPKIDFTCTDIFAFDGSFDAAFLDPDWARGEKPYREVKLASMAPPADRLFAHAYERTHNVALRLPKELGLKELEGLPEHELEMPEMSYSDRTSRFYCAYFGNLVKRK